MNNYKIEKLSLEEYPLIIELWNKAGLPTRPEGRDHPDEIKKQIESDKIAFFGIILEENSKLIGVVLLTDDGRKGWINRLAIDPEYRGKGFAKKLISFSEEYFYKKGIEVWCALIEDYNKESMNLFQSTDYVFHKDIFYFSKRTRKDV